MVVYRVNALKFQFYFLTTAIIYKIKLSKILKHVHKYFVVISIFISKYFCKINEIYFNYLASHSDVVFLDGRHTLFIDHDTILYFNSMKNLTHFVYGALTCNTLLYSFKKSEILLNNLKMEDKQFCQKIGR